MPDMKLMDMKLEERQISFENKLNYNAIFFEITAEYRSQQQGKLCIIIE